MVWVSGSEPEGRNIVIQALLGADTTDRTAAGLGEGLNDDRDPRFSPCQFVQGFWVTSALACALEHDINQTDEGKIGAIYEVRSYCCQVGQVY